ncbi:RNA polymerase sigma factor [Roseivirga misakiensis]|uniref:RNA polymerase subunit sigma-70 n=1 Tax=Roseivirga misakiensis TaxID=1563681 RepID=A0A1E5T695_9BACT|nr:sigma-70 family RNA polymerase sigma factor [Roseivirga misakiensis]OEK06901.1 hypothetical protein BFP71_04400 [Roseivirga misakiensis]
MGEKEKSSKLVERILSVNPKKRSTALTQVYNECFPMVKRYIVKNNGSVEEAKDIFQETITIVYHNLIEQKYRGESALNKYIIGIARNLWLLKLRKKDVPTVTIDGQHSLTQEPDEKLDTHLVSYVLEHLNSGCRNILKWFYFETQSMEEIAKNLNLGSAQAAKTKKLRCMKKLASLIKEHGLEKHHFTL